MLGYTVFVVSRFSWYYYLARSESGALFPDSIGASQTGHTRLVAELSGVGTLKAVAAAAPFLGLAGACYGILEAFYSFGYDYGGFGSIIPHIGVGALVNTAAGIMVAIPAAVSYNILRTRVEKFENSRSSTLLDAAPRSYGFAQTLPLRRGFSGFPAFALIGAPIVALLLPMFALMLHSLIPVGLPVHLVEIGVGDHELPPIVIRVTATNGSGGPAVYVNSKEIPWEELGDTIRAQIEVRPRWIVYVEGGDDVPWAYVAHVIDIARGLHAEIVLLTVTPNIGSGKAPDGRLKKKLGVK